MPPNVVSLNRNQTSRRQVFGQQVVVLFVLADGHVTVVFLPATIVT
jgi:hypothetical protein